MQGPCDVPRMLYLIGMETKTAINAINYNRLQKTNCNKKKIFLMHNVFTNPEVESS